MARSVLLHGLHWFFWGLVSLPDSEILRWLSGRIGKSKKNAATGTNCQICQSVKLGALRFCTCLFFLCFKRVFAFGVLSGEP